MDDFNMNMNNMRNRWKPRKTENRESGKENSGGRGSRSGCGAGGHGLYLSDPGTGAGGTYHIRNAEGGDGDRTSLQDPPDPESAEGKYDNTGFPIGYQQDTNEVVSNEGIMITSDYNFIDVDFFVEYRITEPVKYLYTSQEPVEILKSNRPEL